MWIINHRRWFFLLSTLLVLGSVVAVATWGLRLGTDFRGGTILEVEYLSTAPETSARPETVALREALADLGLESLSIQPAGERGVLIRSGHIDEPTHERVLEALGRLGAVTENRFSAIGPSLGRELARKALVAIVLVVLVIILYIALVFRGVNATGAGRGVNSWKYGLIAIIALVHDVAIPTGIFAALGHFRGVEVDALFLTALLTILGLSVNDTIVVFDRIRENLRRLGGRPFAEVVGQSLRETLVRSFNTSFVVILALLALLFFGGSTTYYFALALAIGMAVGTYSSIFLAAPLLVTWAGRRA